MKAVGQWNGQARPVEPSPDGTTLNLYGGTDAASMTIGSELDKLASNISLFRNFAGVHWRSDYTYSLLLGQAVAIFFLLDTIRTYSEEARFEFTTFEGFRIRIGKSGIEDVSGSSALAGIYQPGFHDP